MEWTKWSVLKLHYILPEYHLLLAVSFQCTSWQGISNLKRLESVTLKIKFTHEGSKPFWKLSHGAATLNQNDLLYKSSPSVPIFTLTNNKLNPKLHEKYPYINYFCWIFFKQFHLLGCPASCCSFIITLLKSADIIVFYSFGRLQL